MRKSYRISKKKNRRTINEKKLNSNTNLQEIKQQATKKHNL